MDEEKKIMTSWKDLLLGEIETTYKAAAHLLDQVDDSMLGWKPSSGSNWMTTAQLLHHLSDACGMAMQGFVTGDWGLPEGMDIANLKPEEMLPPAEKMPSIDSVAHAKHRLESDKQVAVDMVKQCSEDNLEHRLISAPWDPREMKLGIRLLQMVKHLDVHKTQLYYYLKLQGQPVNTYNLWFS